MSEKLLPCPFCNHHAHKRTLEIDETEVIFGYIKKTGKVKKRRSIECRNPDCGIQPSTWLHVNSLEWEPVIKAWNTRQTPDAKDVPSVDRMAKELYMAAIKREAKDKGDTNYYIRWESLPINWEKKSYYIDLAQSIHNLLTGQKGEA